MRRPVMESDRPPFSQKVRKCKTSWVVFMPFSFTHWYTLSMNWDHRK